MGNTDPNESAVCYLKQDNAFYLTGGDNGDTADKHQTRYRYSPVHKEAAVCCVPNAGRIVPYYIQNMWMKDDEGLVAALLGPCELTTHLKNSRVSIKEETGYPYENSIHFTVSCEQVAKFSIKIRKPQWAVAAQSSLPYKEENGFLVFKQLWPEQTSFTVSFTAAIVKKETANKEIYFESGPFVLCHVLEAKQTITKSFNIPGLHESVYEPVHHFSWQFDNESLQPVTNMANTFTTRMFNGTTGRKEEIILEPMAKTILRQVSFQQKK
jgi:hypothetical protein